MKKKLRLVLWDECNRTCKLCANKQHDIGSMPVAVNYGDFMEATRRE